MEFIQLVRRELKVIYHKSAEIFNQLMFFFIITFIFSFAANGTLDASVSTGVIIICFMLASSLSSHFIFERDIESGVLQQLYLSVAGLNNLVFAKICSQWLCFGLPLTFALPIASLFFGLSIGNIFILMFLTVISSFLLSAIAVMIAGVTAGLKSGSVISVILSVPLYIPVIIFNISFIDSRLSENSVSVWSFLESAIGFALIVIPLSIFAVRQTIRNAVES